MLNLSLKVYIVIHVHVLRTSQSTRISDVQFISITISFLLAMVIENKCYFIHIGTLQNVIPRTFYGWTKNSISDLLSTLNYMLRAQCK